MALATNREVNRFVDQELRSFLVKANAHIYKGGWIGRDAATGYVRALVAGDELVGLAYEEIDNTGGANGAKSVRAFTLGDFEVTIAGVVQANVGATVYLSDDATLTLTPTNNSVAGKLVEILSGTQCVLRIHTASMVDTVVGMKTTLVDVTEASSPVALTASDSGKTYTNLGAGGTVHFDLPSAPTAGLRFSFVALVAQEIQIDPGDNDGIFVNGAKQVDGKYIAFDAINEQVVLISNANGDWVAVDAEGTISVEG